MNFSDDPELRLMRETVRRFFATELPPERVREYDEARSVPQSVWSRLAELGLMALPVPESYSGVEGSVAMSAVVTEELASRFASLAVDYVLVSMTARLLVECGSEAQKEEILPRLAAGQLTVAFAMTEPSGGTDVLALSTRATLDADGWLLRGQKLYTSMADEADFMVVLARTDPPEGERKGSGLSLILTPRRQKGVLVRRLVLMGMRAAATCEVFFDDARAPPAALIGERGRGFYHLLATLNNERILAAAISLGIGSAALEEALRYARERHAFGRPIGAFQAIQHYLADTAVELEQARLLVEKAAWLQTNALECAIPSTMAKVAAAEMCVRATDRGMRILAGYGLVQESPMERYFRDARLQVFSPISNEIARSFIAERLGLPKSY